MRRNHPQARASVSAHKRRLSAAGWIGLRALSTRTGDTWAFDLTRTRGLLDASATGLHGFLVALFMETNV